MHLTAQDKLDYILGDVGQRYQYHKDMDQTLLAEAAKLAASNNWEAAAEKKNMAKRHELVMFELSSMLREYERLFNSTNTHS